MQLNKVTKPIIITHSLLFKFFLLIFELFPLYQVDTRFQNIWICLNIWKENHFLLMENVNLYFKDISENKIYLQLIFEEIQIFTLTLLKTNTNAPYAHTQILNQSFLSSFRQFDNFNCPDLKKIFLSKGLLCIFTKPLRKTRKQHKVNSKRTLICFNSKFTFS